MMNQSQFIVRLATLMDRRQCVSNDLHRAEKGKKRMRNGKKMKYSIPRYFLKDVVFIFCQMRNELTGVGSVNERSDKSCKMLTKIYL